MEANLKNYTSSVPAGMTIARIESYLAQCGVNSVTKEYKEAFPVALFFDVTLGPRKYTIRLPAKIAEVQECLYADYCGATRRPRKTRRDFQEQALRTAWKIQQDWVQVQMSLIKLKQADFLQVFMGFVWTGTETFYDKLVAGGMKALPEFVREQAVEHAS